MHNLIVPLAGKGQRFIDKGYISSIEWWGVMVFRVMSNKKCSGFKLTNITAINVTCLLWAQSDENPYSFSYFDIEAKIYNSYYGVSTNRNGRHSRCRLITHNVRRAFICYGCKDWKIDVDATSDELNFGSNGFISIVCDGPQGDCSNIAVKLNLSGISRYTSIIHFYNQGMPNYAMIMNVYCEVVLANLIGDYSLFLFSHSFNGVLNNTPRAFSNIYLDAFYINSMPIYPINNQTISYSDKNSIYYTKRTVEGYDAVLPKYFKEI